MLFSAAVVNAENRHRLDLQPVNSSALVSDRSSSLLLLPKVLRFFYCLCLCSGVSWKETCSWSKQAFRLCLF